MKEFLKQNWFEVGVLIVITVSISGAFYWYEWRPSQIRKNCYKEVVQRSENEKVTLEEGIKRLDVCLVKNGLKK